MFIKSDVLEIPDSYNDQFDLAYLSRGVLVWIPDISLLIRNISKLLKKSGEMFIYDQQPVVHLVDPDSENPGELRFNYFDAGPTEYRGLDYLGQTKYAAKPNFQYMIRISYIMKGILENNMKLTKLLEFSHSIEDAGPNKNFEDAY